MKRRGSLLLVLALALLLGVLPQLAAPVKAAESRAALDVAVLRVDDRVDLSGHTVEILDDGSAADGDAVIALDGSALTAADVGTARLRIDGEPCTVTVEKAKIHVVVIMGQSNAGNHFANATSDITCLPGTAYRWRSGSGTSAGEPVPYTQPSMGFHAPLLAELYAQSAAAGDPVKPVMIWQEGVTSKNGESIAAWAADAGDTAGTDGTVAMIEDCLAYYARHSDRYEVVEKGVYWLQGESDAAMDPNAYTRRFLAMWNRLKGAGMEYLAFFRVRKDVDGYNERHEDLDYTNALAAQISMVNAHPELFLATALTEDWAGAEDSLHSVDISRYYTFMGLYGGNGTYSDAYDNCVTVADGVLTTTMKTLYGANNKCHYGKFGYGLIGADAAYNMYRALHTGEFEVVQTDTSGKAAVRRTNRAGDTVELDISGMTEALSFCAGSGSAAGTLALTVKSGETDITDRVTAKTGRAFGAIAPGRLCQYTDVTITAAYTTAAGATGSVVYQVVGEAPAVAGPRLTIRPADTAAAPGERYRITVEAAGIGLTYQWYYRNAGSAVWYKSAGTDGVCDGVMTRARAGRQICCVISDAAGNSTTTEPVTLYLKND